MKHWELIIACWSVNTVISPVLNVTFTMGCGRWDSQVFWDTSYISSKQEEDYIHLESFNQNLNIKPAIVLEISWCVLCIWSVWNISDSHGSKRACVHADTHRLCSQRASAFSPDFNVSISRSDCFSQVDLCSVNKVGLPSCPTEFDAWLIRDAMEHAASWCGPNKSAMDGQQQCSQMMPWILNTYT